MSVTTNDPLPGDARSCDALELVAVPPMRDLGGFQVRRALPHRERQMVGPFIFFDQMGPAQFAPGQGVDVRPHPHIGLATVTYLFQGEFQHRDSLGTDQIIHPGAVNWMIAGQGVTHSERTSAATRQHPHSLFGIQTWVALPETAEDGAAGFEHQPKAALPVIEADGATARLILGEAWGQRAPVRVFNEMFYADVELTPGAKAPLPDGHEDRGLYIVSGSITVGGQDYGAAQMMVFRPGDRLHVTAGPGGARLMLLGGETMAGPRFIWWNFVASSRERIEAAKEAWRAGDWAHGRFQLPPGDDAEFIPLPEERPGTRPREVR